MSLPENYAGVALEDVARAGANLALLESRLSPRLLELLPRVLAQVPDPDTALNNLERFTRSAGRRVLDGMARQPSLLHYLLALFSHTRFLSEVLILQPDLILWLGRDKHIARLKSKEDLLEEYARFATTSLEDNPSLVLVRFKKREYLRIALKDILKIAELTETTLELSILADVLLEKALRIAGQELQNRYGQPQATDALGRTVPARFAVVSLGKLGGNELNYSSDIDLLFLYAGEGFTAAGRGQERISNGEFFLRLAQRLLKIIAGVTPEGSVFRVDLRLRPGGGEGDVAISLPAAIRYYRDRARDWELQMLVKARHSAGNAQVVREFQRAVEPHLYRSEMHFAAVESVLNAREQFDRVLERGEGRVNVKLVPGGIRDVEFLVQCLQRLYGRTDPWVRSAGTLLGLQRLYDKGYLSSRDHHRLAAAYQFLRLLEHRLQLDLGQQTHTLPAEPRGLEVVARRCRLAGHFDPLAAHEMQRLLRNHLQHVREIYERVLPSAPPETGGEEFDLQAEDAAPLSGAMDAARVLEELRRRSPSLYRELCALTIREAGRKAVQRFLSAVVASSEAFERATHAVHALPLAVGILEKSDPIGELLIRQPQRVEQLPELCRPDTDVATLPLPLALPEPPAGRALTALAGLAGGQASLSRRMAVLRQYYRDELFRWGTRELCGRRSLEEGLGAFTALAEDVLRAGLAVAAEETGIAPDSVAVVALGRLGTCELDYASDADLIFLTARAQTANHARPLVEKFLHVISGYTREGTLLAVDPRLRPRGSEGELVQTADGVLDYFRSKAEVWEAATYLKARPVAGDPGLGRNCCEQLRGVLKQRFSDWDKLCRGLQDMRQRLEVENSEPGVESNLKTGPGGFYDLDFIFSGLALRTGGLALSGRTLPEQAGVFGEAGALKAEEKQVLAEAARLLRAVDHAIRLVTGRSLTHLPVGPRMEAVAELTSRWMGEALSPETLPERLADSAAAVRKLFHRILT